MARRHAGIVLALVALAGAGAAARQWPTYSVAEAPAAMRPAVQRADLLIISLQTALLSEIRRELESGGPAGALAACHIDAAGVAYRIARDEGIAVGRTSARLRNPANAPRPWAAPIVARYADSRGAGVEGYVVDLGDRIGVLKPIVEQASCAPCHGVGDKLDARVRTMLPDRYPVDRAVGFKDGDLRGWFWVEIPKR